MQALLDGIDTDHNASTLELGYFLHRGVPPLPQTDGYGLLAAALDKEPVTSRRWFELQSVRAFAAFRVRDVSPDDGFRAYDLIFSHAADAPKVKATDVLRQAIRTYVFSLAGRLSDIHLLQDDRTGPLLLKAWTASLHLVPSSKRIVPEPPWSEAIQQAYLQDTFRPAVDKALGDPVIPKTYGLLKTAATAYWSKDRKRALGLLQQAGPLLPPDTIERGWYYSTLTEWLTDNRDLAQAIRTAQAEIKATGRGRGTLASLQLQTGDFPGFRATLATLSAPGGDRAEMNVAADEVTELHAADPRKNKAAEDETIAVLSHYLSSPRKRDLEQELHAREDLAELLIEQSRFSEAKSVLTAGRYTLPLPTPGDDRYYSSIQQILAELTPESVTDSR